MFAKYTRVGQRGDTIVEVMFALAVLGAVLGSSFVIVNRSAITARMSQERQEAVKLAETQFERLQVNAALDPTIHLRSSPFCLSTSNAIVSTPNPACIVNAAGEPTTDELQYHIELSNLARIDSPITGQQIGSRFNVVVTWQNVKGTTDTVSYRYEVYKL